MTDERLAEIEAYVRACYDGLESAAIAINELIAEVRRLRAEVDRVECDRDRTEEAFALFRMSLDTR